MILATPALNHLCDAFFLPSDSPSEGIPLAARFDAIFFVETPFAASAKISRIISASNSLYPCDTHKGFPRYRDASPTRLSFVDPAVPDHEYVQSLVKRVLL